MKAYVEILQRKEREIGCNVLTHQKWSGADYVDNLLKTVTGGVSSTAAMGKGVTESQFTSKLYILKCAWHGKCLEMRRQLNKR